MSPKRRSGRGGDDEDGALESKKTKSGPLVGEDCPDFELETDASKADDKKTAAMKDIVKDNGVVLFFYPKANTPGCTKQASGFRDNYDRLVAAGYVVYGMSADKPSAQSKWKAKLELPYTLLCDPTFEAMKALGVRKADKRMSRSHIIIEKGGKIKDIKIGVPPAVSVAEAVKTICGEDAVVDDNDAPEPEEEANDKEANDKEANDKDAAQDEK